MLLRTRRTTHNRSREKKMKKIYIVGAGGYGREVLSLILDIHAISGPRWQVMGFLDDTEDPLHDKQCDFPVVGRIQDYVPKENEVLAFAIASPEAKQILIPMLKARGASFENIIHPYAYLGRHSTLGEGVVLYGGVSISINSHIGNFVTLLSSMIGHDVEIGDYSTISGSCNIMGNVSIGKSVFIGGNVAIAPHVRIEDSAYICLGSVVMKNVKAGRKLLGNPAKEIG